MAQSAPFAPIGHEMPSISIEKYASPGKIAYCPALSILFSNRFELLSNTIFRVDLALMGIRPSKQCLVPAVYIPQDPRKGKGMISRYGALRREWFFGNGALLAEILGKEALSDLLLMPI
jgi:hypothetical protein